MRDGKITIINELEVIEKTKNLASKLWERLNQGKD